MYVGSFKAGENRGQPKGGGNRSRLPSTISRGSPIFGRVMAIEIMASPPAPNVAECLHTRSRSPRTYDVSASGGIPN